MCAASVHVSRGFVVGLVWVLVAVLSPSLAVAASDADRHWTYIEQIENDGRSELAVEEIQRFVSEFPEDPRTPSALLRLASLQRSEGRPLAAVDAWTVLLDDHPRSEHAPRAALELATTLVAVGRTPEASDAYRHLIREYPHHELAERAALRLARLLQDRGSHDEARRILGRLVGTRASDEVAAWALLELARIELATGDRTSAIEGFDAVHGRHPRSEAGAEALRGSEPAATARSPCRGATALPGTPGSLRRPRDPCERTYSSGSSARGLRSRSSGAGLP